MTVLELRRDQILHGSPDSYGIDASLAARKDARANGRVYVSPHTRRKA